ncbi:MAG: kelch repeat-containing protein, partial [Smithella sp.]|nr:kelch repeat-containing protein [Smithella sp.]
MKKSTLFLVVVFFCFLHGGMAFAAPDTWTQKTDFGGVVGTERVDAVGFSIGSKGYVGTGYDGSQNTLDFWEYDPVSDTWTQKADFAGTARQAAVGFAIENKGYVGTGYDGVNTRDFWEYDPS